MFIRVLRRFRVKEHRIHLLFYVCALIHLGRRGSGRARLDRTLYPSAKKDSVFVSWALIVEVAAGSVVMFVSLTHEACDASKLPLLFCGYVNIQGNRGQAQGGNYSHSSYQYYYKSTYMSGQHD